MKILHITFWYPNANNKKEALWIKNHITSLPMDVKGDIIHFEIKQSNSYNKSCSSEGNLKQIIYGIPIRSWILIEVLFGCWLFYHFTVKRIYKRYDIVNFHIAYPMLTYWHWIKKFVNKPIVITEHWSAYHFNFGTNKELPRIQRIFKQNIPVISVSHSLLDDIKRFARADFPAYVIPNIVNEKIFYPDKTIKRENYFFMVSQWKWPKQPLVVFNAFKIFITKNPEFKLIIGGYGSDYKQMQQWVIDNKMEQYIVLNGVLQEQQIVEHLKKCKAFIHCSEYETFSVVCAEAVSCNTPVIASNVGGIPEVVGKNEGLLIDSYNSKDWLKAMNKALDNEFEFVNDLKFGREKVGNHYYKVLKRCVDDFRQ